jgi:hypothetical protein
MQHLSDDAGELPSKLMSDAQYARYEAGNWPRQNFKLPKILSAQRKTYKN